MSGSLKISNCNWSIDHCVLFESIIQINAAWWSGINSRMAFINISALKCSVYSRVAFNRTIAVPVTNVYFISKGFTHWVNSNFALAKFKQSSNGELISQPKLPDIWHCFHFNWARLMGSSSWMCGLLEWNISKLVIKSSCRCKFKSIISKYQTYKWRDWIPQEIVLLLSLERRQSLQHRDHC